MSSEMDLQIAKALWTDYWDGEPCAWDEMEENARKTALSMARAALAAMREPTEAMIEAGAITEAEDWDGRTFAALSQADKRRYRERFAAAFRAAMLSPERGKVEA